MTLPVTLADVRTAAERIADVAHRTPVATSRQLDEACGARIFLKCEQLQRVGAFKLRGAMNTVRSLGPKELAYGVATHSSGNHAAALALAARLSGHPAHIVMPDNAPRVKRAAVAGYGARIVDCQATQTAREATLADVVHATGATFVHPYEEPRVVAGQGTAALELLDEVPNLDVVLTPVGGGGLLSGTAVAATENSRAEVIGAEPEGADDAHRSFYAGQRIAEVDARTVCDGLRTALGALPFAIITDRVSDVVTVSDAATVRAMRWVFERMKMVIEPSSAVPVAAVMERRLPERFRGARIGIVLSGGNVDLDRLPWTEA